jgi:hypothetical protein
VLYGVKSSFPPPAVLDRWLLIIAAAFVGVMSTEALLYICGLDESIFVLRALGLVSETGYMNAGGF